jgi:hypothetical protein
MGVLCIKRPQRNSFFRASPPVLWICLLDGSFHAGLPRDTPERTLSPVRRTRTDAQRSRAFCLLVLSTPEAAQATLGHGAAIRPAELLCPGLCDTGSTSMPSEASGHQKAYKELLAHIDDGHALTLDEVQHEIIRFSRSHALRAFALTHAGNSPVCNHCCPRCCDTRGETPRPSHSSSSPRSHSSSHAGSPRRTFSATAFPVNTFCRDLDLDPDYHVLPPSFKATV